MRVFSYIVALLAPLFLVGCNSYSEDPDYQQQTNNKSVNMNEDTHEADESEKAETDAEDPANIVNADDDDEDDVEIEIVKNEKGETEYRYK